MHAFDYNYLKGGKITVRRADMGEKITTLDGVERTLTDKMLVIADARKGRRGCRCYGRRKQRDRSRNQDHCL